MPKSEIAFGIWDNLVKRVSAKSLLKLSEFRNPQSEIPFVRNQKLLYGFEIAWLKRNTL
jgi:hypothetical protein